MSWLVIRNVWMLLLAMALSPVQVSAAHSSTTPIDIDALYTVNLSDSESNSESSSQVPISQSRVTQDAVGIFSSHRWSSNLRKTVDDEGETFDSQSFNPFYTNIGYAYSLSDIRWLHNQSTFYHYSPNHRLSGWKDSNAMYVALNGQYAS
ncbi:hypothetical protein [Vibrio maerlii]|uniref:hypothetical protein n=1 Tax=Vibrio maerlii TaxID=2231648 RepID=UPI000E3CAE4A|nr:hypothetical protein [Vibrio maerlii]